MGGGKRSSKNHYYLLDDDDFWYTTCTYLITLYIYVLELVYGLVNNSIVNNEVSLQYLFLLALPLLGQNKKSFSKLIYKILIIFLAIPSQLSLKWVYSKKIFYIFNPIEAEI